MIELARTLNSHIDNPLFSKPSYDNYCQVLPKKIEFERDRNIFDKFSSQDVLFQYLNLVASDYQAFCLCYGISLSLLASLIGKWYRSEKGLHEMTEKLLAILGKVNAFLVLPKTFLTYRIPFA